MIQLFEQTSIDSNCDIGPNDAPFTMPLMPHDHIFLRLQVPYYLVDFNGGGLPIGANISVSIWNVVADTQYCGYGAPSTNRYLYNFVNDGTKRIGEYRFMIPLRLTDDYVTKAFTVVAGDNILATIDGVNYNWIYGTDSIPYPFLEYVSGGICVRIPTSAVFTLYVNGSGVIAGNLFTDDSTTCFTNECFRVRIGVQFGAVWYYYYTKVFQMVKCDEDTILLQSQYGANMVDCAGQFYRGATNYLGVNNLYLRIAGDTERVPSKLTKIINAKCFQYKSDITKQIRLRSLPMPSWFQDAVETIALGKNFSVDNDTYQIETENIFENNDNIGSVFQNLNVILSICKCENVFVC